MWQIIIKAWGKKRVDPGGETRRTEGELSASIRYLFTDMTSKIFTDMTSNEYFFISELN